MSESLSTLLCPQCGYDLHAIERSDHCPECGWTIDRTGLAASQIPWTFRGESLGRWRAYVRTVWLGVWRMKRLAAEIARPVSLRDAKRFATITALAAGLPYVVMVLAAVVSEGGTAFLAPLDLRSPQSSSNPSLLPPAADLQVPYVAGMTRWPVLPLAIVIFAWLCTRVTPWFLRRAGERAEALGYYTSAALVLPLIATAFFIAGLGALYVHSSRPGGGAGGGDDWMLYVTFGTGSALVVLGFALWWINVLSLQRRIAQPTLRRMIWTALGVPAAWYACALVSFMLFPWLAGLLWLMYESVCG